MQISVSQNLIRFRRIIHGQKKIIRENPCNPCNPCNPWIKVFKIFAQIIKFLTVIALTPYKRNAIHSKQNQIEEFPQSKQLLNMQKASANPRWLL